MDDNQKSTVAGQKEKKWEYVGPQPPPLISNLPHDLNNLRLGTGPVFPADELPAEYIPYVQRTNPTTEKWWRLA